MKRNPIEIADYIRDEFSEYISASTVIDDESYQKQLTAELKSVDLFNGPYLHTSLPFVKGKSINELVASGELSKEFKKLRSLDLDRRLYAHQELSIKAVKEKRNIVITTGTGSGKTESFLYPIVNHIMCQIESGTKTRGVKAIFLYPMNALVNDQRDRVREMLRYYPEITFGSYTGETPDKMSTQDRKRLEIEEGTTFPENELLSREEIRKKTPDILFTNYSMLEYLLLRPDDKDLINRTIMSNWQFIVLDEAHTYKGSLGIEISYLLKRLTGFVDKNPQFILTSATLGDKDSIDDIVSFAKNLTSANYESSDIIFGIREPLDRSHIKYQIKPDLYVELKNNIENLSRLKSIAAEYADLSHESDSEGLLYELLKCDKNTYLLFDEIDGTCAYEEVINKMYRHISINDEQLVALIQLISLGNKKGDFLYDAKFHMFVSGPNKAFVTLGDDKQIRFGNHAVINGKKAFNVGACKNCSHMYIIGNIINNRLEPNDTIDLYENYDEEIHAQLDYFVLENDEEHEKLTKYIVCSKCGWIYMEDNVNAEACDCGANYRVSLYKVNNEGSSLQNNLYQCAYCGQTSNRGVIRSFHLNKDTATSILSEIYYEGMEESGNPVGFNDEPVIDMFAMPVEMNNSSRQAKQLLAFSDSRQQASYFAVAFAYNHERILRRRIVWDIVKNVDRIDVKSLMSKLTYSIKENKYFTSEIISDQSQAWISILRDILYCDGQTGSDGVGLYTYEYELDESLPVIKRNESGINSIFGLTVPEFVTLLRQTIIRFRMQNAINYQTAELSVEERKDAFQYSGYDKYFALKKQERTKEYEASSIVSFLPIKKDGINTTIDYLMRLKKCDVTHAAVLAEKLFYFMINLGLLSSETVAETTCYRLNAERFYAVPYHHNKWYICKKCKKLTVHNIQNICPQKECNGTLEECDPDLIMGRNYYRRGYMKEMKERIVVQEHTAQLSKQKAREYQKDFKNKKINILSCSTTFEMGVDLGSLENVFLRNVPPSPANYVQRAGRAGRSKDAAALVVTYCGNSSHDYAYFTNPRQMIDGIVNPPLFDNSNEKIAIRHIIASSLTFFFRKYPDLFRNTQALILDDSMQTYKEYIKSKPTVLRDYIDTKVLCDSDLNKYKNFGWLDSVLPENSRLNLFLGDIQDKLSTFEEAREKAVEEKEYKLAEYFNNQIRRMARENVLTMMSRDAVIPKYGFPVDVVGLTVMSSDVPNRDLNLERDLSIAISEYAPDSEIIVDGNKYVSRYINVPRSGELERHYYYECPACGHTEISELAFGSDTVCSFCGTPIGSCTDYFIIPELGFATASNEKRSRTIRPKKTYTGRIKYLGGGEEDVEAYTTFNAVGITSIRNDQLAVINENKFYSCPVCGYTKIKYDAFKPSITERSNHNNARHFRCDNKKLQKIALGHLFKTDVIRLSFHEDVTFDELVTLTYALIEGMCRELQLESNDINGLVSKSRDGEYDIVLFDNVPGGAGHVKRLTDRNTFVRVLKSAYGVVSQNCCDPETTCYHCLRSYYNQTYHLIMRRRYAKELLEKMLSSEVTDHV